MSDRPMAAPGLTSYRCKSPYGWIMIGAKDHADAMKEARRSSDNVTEAGLEIWNGEGYVPVTAPRAAPKLAQIHQGKTWWIIPNGAINLSAMSHGHASEAAARTWATENGFEIVEGAT